MAKQTKLTVEKRELTGRKVKQLRQQNILPANIYGKDVKSLAVKVDQQKFLKVFEETGETSLIEVSVSGEKKVRPVLITNLHLDPVTGEPLHADLRQVDLKEKVSAEVPVQTTGESPAVKDAGGVLMINISEIEVEALPTDIPDEITVDISQLANIGDIIQAKDLKLDRSKVTISLDEDATIISVQEQMEEEPEPEVEAPEGEEAPAAEAEGAEVDQQQEGSE